MATPVIIPVRNEEATIGPIVKVFNEHPETKTAVFVGIDHATVDNSPLRVRENGGYPVRTLVHGKGQVVYQTLLAVSALPIVNMNRIILCDGDYTGLTLDHIDEILKPRRGMIIGVPDWPEIDVPEHVTNAWPHVSGFRCLPWVIVPPNAHGYLLETQLNLAAVKLHLPVKHIYMDGLKSPFQWPLSEKRNTARETDRKWGVDNGVFK